MKKLIMSVVSLFRKSQSSATKYEMLEKSYKKLGQKIENIEKSVAALHATTSYQSELISALATSYHDMIKSMYEYPEDIESLVESGGVIFLPSDSDDDEFLN